MIVIWEREPLCWPGSTKDVFFQTFFWQLVVVWNKFWFMKKVYCADAGHSCHQGETKRSSGRIYGRASSRTCHQYAQKKVEIYIWVRSVIFRWISSRPPIYLYLNHVQGGWRELRGFLLPWKGSEWFPCEAKSPPIQRRKTKSERLQKESIDPRKA